MRVVMLGTGPFAVPTLRALSASRHEVLRVVTRPPRGRRAETPPMEAAARELGLEVWQPETVNSEGACAALRGLAPDLLVVCDYGEILKPPALGGVFFFGFGLTLNPVKLFQGGSVPGPPRGRGAGRAARRRDGGRTRSAAQRARRRIGVARC
jgi:methionyl-tRNA formyltransferase